MDYILHYFDTYALDAVYETGMAGARYVQEQLLLPAWALGTRQPKCQLLFTGINRTAAAALPDHCAVVSGVPVTSILGWLPDLTDRHHPLRQLLSLFVIVTVFGHLLYTVIASASYRWIYDRRQEMHPRFLKNQIALEKQLAHTSMAPMGLLTIPWFFGQLHGYSRLYDQVEDYGWPYLLASTALFLFFTDMGIYWIHRGLHHRWVYRTLHKPHHRWIIPTPFASHAFHFLDGYLQSVPYHIFVCIIPMHKLLYLALFVFVNIWTVLIHDGEYFAHHPIINGAAHHTVHHEQFNYNYGQYFTLWDRLGGTYRAPDQEVATRKAMLTEMVAATADVQQ